VDLSQAAAEKVGLIKSGVARVKVELVKTPLPLDQGGRWAVQIGAFQEEDPARALAGRLSRRYQTAKVLCFSSPVGDWWVRVRVQHDERTRAEALVHETSTPEGSIFLVRLD
jgi:rare lipoprotein A